MKRKGKMFFVGSIVLVIVLVLLFSRQLRKENSDDYNIAVGGWGGGIDPYATIGTTNFPVSMSADEMKEKAISKDFVVFEGFRLLSGKETWQEFYEKTQTGEPAVVYLAKYYTISKENMSEELYEQEKDEYPKLFLFCLMYDGEEYTVIDRPGYEEEPETARTYPYLKRLTGEPSSVHALFDSYDYYVLVHDPEVTWKELEWGMFSSQLGDYIDYYMVYGEHLTEQETN